MAEAGRQRLRVGLRQAAHHELREPRRAHHRRFVARREQDDDRVGGEASGREAQRLRRGRVEQVGVVDDHGERPVLGHAAEQAEHRGADGEPLAAGPGQQRERRAERLGLRCGDGVEVVQHRAQELRAEPPNGTSRSASTPAARRTRMPASATAAAASSSSALLPIPASPDSSSVPLSPTRAEATSLLMTCRSRSRPTSTDRV